MKDFLENTDWKVWAGMAGGIIVIFVLIFSLITIFQSKQSSQQSKNPTSSSLPNSNSPQNSVPSSNNSTSQETPYHNNSYSLSYPSNWQTNTGSVVRNGTVTKFHPADLNSYPVLAVQVTTESSDYTNQVRSNLTSVKFQSHETTIDNIPATEFDGIMFNSMEEIVYLINTNNKTYLITYDYVPTDLNERTELTQIMSTFNFQ